MFNISNIFKRKDYPIFKVRIYKKGKGDCSKCDHHRDLYATVKKDSINLHTFTANWTYRNICYRCIKGEITKFEKTKEIIIIIDES